MDTPRKSNIDPKNEGLEDEVSFQLWEFDGICQFVSFCMVL